MKLRSTEQAAQKKLDGILSGLKREVLPSYEQIIWMCIQIKEVFRKEGTLLQLHPPLVICGDVHGQFEDLMRIFERCGRPRDTTYLFLGDYVGRGPRSIDTILYLIALKLRYPTRVILLRGNHECERVSRTDGFYEEFGDVGESGGWHSLVDAFRWMPLAAVIGGRIFCVHGGLSKQGHPLKLEKIGELKLPLDIPSEGMICDLVWSDPRDGSDWGDSARGISHCFGPAPVDAFLEANGLDLMVRAHQCAQDGICFPFKEKKTCMTVFSAPGYCGDSNCGAVVIVNDQMVISAEYFEPVKTDKTVPKKK